MCCLLARYTLTVSLTQRLDTGDKDYGTMWTVNCSNVQFDFDAATLEVRYLLSCIYASNALLVSNAAGPGTLSILLVCVVT